MPRTLPFFILLALFCLHCRDKKQLEAARGNALAHAAARCQCEKLQRQDPPGDTTRCSEDMARSLRYLNINFEFGKFSAETRQEIQKIGDEAFEKCMKTP